jgi:hypothetical protein
MNDLLAALIVETPAKRWLRQHLDHQDKEFCLIWPFNRAQNGYAPSWRRSPRSHEGHVRA